MSDRQRTETVRAGDELPVSQTVLETVAEVTGNDVTALAPLYEAVEPEALDDLLSPRPNGDGEPLGIAFEYSGCQVTVERKGETVTVTATPETV